MILKIWYAKPDVAGIHIATPVFDGAHEKDVFETLGHCWSSR